MAITCTQFTGANKNPTFESYGARGIGFYVGNLQVTYSGTGGMTWSGPFNTNLFVMISPASNYLPVLNSGQVKIYLLSTATMSEVASDVDFTLLSGTGFAFCAIGGPA